jgi:hypothetical protein
MMQFLANFAVAMPTLSGAEMRGCCIFPAVRPRPLKLLNLVVFRYRIYDSSQTERSNIHFRLAAFTSRTLPSTMPMEPKFCLSSVNRANGMPLYR